MRGVDEHTVFKSIAIVLYALASAYLLLMFAITEKYDCNMFYSLHSSEGLSIVEGNYALSGAKEKAFLWAIIITVVCGIGVLLSTKNKKTRRVLLFIAGAAVCLFDVFFIAITIHINSMLLLEGGDNYYALVVQHLVPLITVYNILSLGLIWFLSTNPRVELNA